MNILSDAIRLLSQVPGSLIYHLVVLFAFEFAAVVAYQGYRRSAAEKDDPQGNSHTSGVWLVAALALVAGRLGLVILALLARLGALDSSLVAAPLERAVDTASIGFILWACLSVWRGSRLFNSALILNMLAAMAVGVAFVLSWTPVPASSTLGGYDASLQATIWEVWQLALLGIGLVLVPAFTADRLLAESLLVILFAGHLGHFLISPVTIASDAPGTARLAMLIAAPLWAALVYRQTEAVSVPQLAKPPTEWIRLVKALRALTQADPGVSVEEVLANGTRMSALLLNADLAAVALDENGGQIRLTAVYDRKQNQHRIAMPIPADEQSFLRSFEQDRGAVLLMPDDEGHHLRPVYESMASEGTGPLLLQPIRRGDDTQGLLLIGNPSSQQSFSSTDLQMADLLVHWLATEWIQSRQYVAAVNQVARMTEELRQAETATVEREVALETELAEARSTVQQLQAQLQRLEVEQGDTREKLRSLLPLMGVSESAIAGKSDPVDMSDFERMLKGVLQRDASLVALAQELRPSLTAVTNYSDLLLGETVGLLGALQRKFLHKIRATMNQASLLLDDIAYLSSATPFAPRVMGQQVQIPKVLDEVLARQSMQFGERSLTLDLEIAQHVPPIQADRDSLSQILGHLVLNACLASPPDGRITIQILCEASPTGEPESECVMVSIHNDGQGIPAEDQRRVFNWHDQLDGRPIPGLGEHGVGLSIVKALIEAHSGQIWIDSQPGRGTTFHVLLPIHPWDNPVLHQPEPATGGNPSRAAEVRSGAAL